VIRDRAEDRGILIREFRESPMLVRVTLGISLGLFLAVSGLQVGSCAPIALGLICTFGGAISMMVRPWHGISVFAFGVAMLVGFFVFGEIIYR
jgi:hypothetical protein